MKTNKFALLTLILLGLFSLNISAQKTETDQNLETDILQKYIEVSALPMGKRQKAFSESPDEMKANLFKFHLAFQFVKRPNLTKDQKEVILEGISNISAEDYNLKKDRTNTMAKAQAMEGRAVASFSRQEVYEIFANLESSESDLAILKKYQELTKSPFEIVRRQTFISSSDTDQSSTIRIHLIKSLVEKQLNNSQSEFIVSLLDTLTPKTYKIAQNKKSSEWTEINKKIENWITVIPKIFSEDDAVEIFTSLGGKEGKPESLLLPNCVCKINRDFCGVWRSRSNCQGGGCKEANLGCGLLFLENCNGMCYD
jgi:hypothetical protein